MIFRITEVQVTWVQLYIKCCDVKQRFMYLLLCRLYYFKHTVSVKWKAYWVWLPKNTMLIKKRVRYLLVYQHVQIFWYGSTLRNKYCKTWVRERTLLRSWFVKACGIILYFCRHYRTQSPALFQNIFKFYTFFPKFSNTLPFFSLF